ncbi:MAG TPA: hypothetical protein DD670_09180 [Planctomycetaceae bacterium]|nr:hypothetical protein [Planctomycetaceae bacterium]
MLPAIPVAGGTVTTGMIHSKRATYWSWPIWSGAIDYNVIRSLLGLSQIHKEIFDRSELAKMGICEVYRSSVVKPTGRYRNFTPAQPV